MIVADIIEDLETIQSLMNTDVGQAKDKLQKLLDSIYLEMLEEVE